MLVFHVFPGLGFRNKDVIIKFDLRMEKEPSEEILIPLLQKNGEQLAEFLAKTLPAVTLNSMYEKLRIYVE